MTFEYGYPRMEINMNEIITIFQNYPFLQTEWFYTMLTFVATCTSAVVALGMWRVDSKQKIREEKLQTLSRIVQIDIELKAVYRDAWAKIAAYHGDSNKEILQKDVKQIKQDHIRMSIFQVIDILADVHKHFNSFNLPMDENWEAHFYHTFHPVRRKAFVTAFLKYEADERFGKQFVCFVKEIIEYHNNNPDSTFQMKKDQEVA